MIALRRHVAPAVLAAALCLLYGCGSPSTKEEARRRFMAAVTHELHYPWQSWDSVDEYRTRQLRQAARMDPDNGDYWWSLAELLDNDDPERERCFRRAMDLNPKLKAQYYFNKARAQCRSADYADAFVSLKSAEEADPQNALEDYLKAYCYTQIGKRGEAFRAIQQGNRKGQAWLYVSPLDKAFQALHGYPVGFPPGFSLHSLMRELARQMASVTVSHVAVRPGKVTILSKPHRNISLKTPRYAEQLFLRGQSAKADRVCYELSRMAAVYARMRPEDLITVMVGEAIDQIAVLARAEFRWRNDHAAAFDDIAAHLRQWQKLRIVLAQHIDRTTRLIDSPTFHLWEAVLGGDVFASKSLSGRSMNTVANIAATVLRVVVALLLPLIASILSGAVCYRVWRNRAPLPTRLFLAVALVVSLAGVAAMGWLVYYEGFDPLSRAFTSYYLRHMNSIDGGETAFARKAAAMVPEPMKPD